MERLIIGILRYMIAYLYSFSQLSGHPLRNVVVPEISLHPLSLRACSLIDLILNCYCDPPNVFTLRSHSSKDQKCRKEQVKIGFLIHW